MKSEITIRDSGMKSYNLTRLNDKQRADLFGMWDEADIMFISISINRDNDKLVLNSGLIYKIVFSLTGVKDYIKM